MTHDPLCPSLGRGALPVIDLCCCRLIPRIRDDERRRIVALLREEFPKPTLGIQKAIRLVEG